MKLIGIREARARLAELIEQAGGGEPTVLTRRGPGRKQAVLLPIEAAAVWQRHLAEQEAAQQRRAQEKELGERLPVGSRAPVCPTCKSSYLRVAYTGPVVHALVNTADPAAGVQDVVVDPDVAQLEKVAWVRCASCWEPLADGPRRPGSPARRAAVEIAENASWADVPWEATNPLVVKEEEMGRASRIVLQHDLARGAIQRVSRWEYLTGITDAEREKMRAERLARGEPYDYDLIDDAQPFPGGAARDQDPDATPHHVDEGEAPDIDADGPEALPATEITAALEETEPDLDTEHDTEHDVDADRPRLTLVVSDRPEPGDAGARRPGGAS
ncbi:type II toxin-antitoxin system Phd/YefM family antitoxin [Nonomuraea basaltis]|uniref:type II toxin-antitoxin system Phd/YefM family antitoxin n=1 Tax=Nonomuraea basaltis TaxID=2495887 RepID=UPI00148615F3|nr:type II toxin-antitoxin system Phd/YefM family antitoxin [Nonomuraea basaltis]